MHRKLFLLLTIALTCSVQGMDHRAITVHTKQIGAVNAQFKHYAKMLQDEQKQKRSLDYEFATIKNRITGNTNATAQCFMDYDFQKTVGRPSLPEAHLNLSKVPPTVLNAIQRYNGGGKSCNNDKVFYTCFAALPEEIRYLLIGNHLFAGNQETAAVFNSKPYGQSMLTLAYALEGIKNNPIYWLTSTEQLSIALESPEAHRFCLWMNKSFKKGESPKINLHEERFLATKMPQIILKNINKNLQVACQLPYKERILPALQQGLSYGSVAATGMLLTDIINSATGFGNPIVAAFNNAIITQAPQSLYYASNILCVMTPYVYTVSKIGTKTITKRYFMSREEEERIFRVIFSYSLTLMGVIQLYFLKMGYSLNSTENTPILVAELIAGTLGGTYGIGSSLYQTTNSYPVKKTIGDIIAQNKK